MKLLTISFTLAALAAAPGFAGGPTVIADDPAPAAAPTPAAVHDWSGAYVGLSYGTASGEVQFDPGSFSELEGGTVAGAHVGYLFQRGAFVYGGEVAYGTINDMLYPNFGEGSGVDHVLDLKAKAGYAANRALFYGVLGYSQATLRVDGGVWEMDGVAVGAGMDYALTDSMTLGLEYLSRDVSALPNGGGVNEANTTVDTLSLRVGLSF